ncbi:MAG: hypothetical protein LBV47_05395 [Bacteroidales bacterium]|nr:hypothetical protein [Bacteroidales bacterium]
MEQIERKKQGLMPVLVILAMAATSSCTILTTSKSNDMEQDLQIDSTLIMDKFYVSLFNENQERGRWEYIAPDGTKVWANRGKDNYLIQLIPAHDYYVLAQYYDEHGRIRERGKFSWHNGFAMGTEVGDWEYYDGNGIKTVVNKDTYGELTYEDVIRKLEARGILNRRTGKNREDLKIYFHPTESYWYVFIVNGAGTIEGKYCEIHIHKDTGRILEDQKGPFYIIDSAVPPTP